MLWIFLSVAAIIFVLHGVLAVAHPYQLDYGEAPLVDQARRLAAGQSIYRADLAAPPYTISNYPPLYVALLAPLVALFGPAFWTGRALSLISTLVAALCAGLIVHTHTRDRVAAWASGLLLLAVPYVVTWSPLLRIDMLALALSLAGLLVLSRAPLSRRGLVAAAALLVAAAYTRQSYGLAAPLAAFVWLWPQDRRQALRLAALVGGAGMGLLLALNLLTGGGFFFNIVTANANEFRWDSVAHHWRDLRGVAPLLLALAGAWIIAVPARETENARSWWLLSPYLLGATLSALTIGKVGSNVNYLLELSAALCMSAGALVAVVGKRQAAPGWSLLRSALLVVLAIQAGVMMRATLRDPVERLKGRIKAHHALEALHNTVQEAAGPVLADEYMGMLTRQKRPLYLQPFEMSQLANDGAWDQAPLLDSIRDQEFSLILIHHFMNWAVYKERWTPEMLTAIMEHYVPSDFQAETLVYRPRALDETPVVDLEACDGAPWRLPTQGAMGMWWISKELNPMGEGYEGAVPVYAVADGLLLRRPEWGAAVAIQHEDPVRPGEMVWSFYGDMGAAWSDESFVVAAFPPGTEGMPVRRGQLLGHQGRRWAQGGGIWVHLRFAVLPALPEGGFPAALVGVESAEDPPLPQEIVETGVLDPSPYLGTIRSRVMGQPVWLPLRCQE